MRIGTFLTVITILSLLLVLSCGKECPGPNEIFLETEEVEFIGHRPLIIDKGTMITWVNKDDKVHTVTSDDLLFSSEDLNESDTFSFIFSESGAYSYHSQHDSAIKGLIIVQ